MTVLEWFRQLRRRRVIEANGRQVDAATIEAIRRRADELEERLERNSFGNTVTKELRG